MLHYLRPRKDFERSVVDDFFGPSFFSNSYNVMRTDVTENEKEYLFEVELPGYTKEDVKITLEDGYMNIKVEKKSENNEENEKNYIRRERYYTTASRSYYVGNVDSSMIKAKFSNGILNITVPKEQMQKTENLISID